MKLVTVSIDLVIDDTIDILNDKTTNGDYYSKTKIVDYLNDKMYSDPEFFGGFVQENIVSITDF
jgi:hypothetical protein